ncbi:MAG: transcriptional activator RfaH [Afipia sp.]|nr:transcriptional activator RfaH [Afipia sp.]MCR6737143.1 transcriptional activator RfaH [Afipia sp.]
MTMGTDAAWYVVHTQVNGEAKAARNLVQQGFEIYLPSYLKRRSHARKIKEVVAPLFPRYLFVRIDMATQRWRSIQSTLGVCHLVANGQDPTPVSRDVLSLLKSREDQSGLIKMDRVPQFSLGDKVRVLAGAFADSLGLYDGANDRDRVAILLDFLGRKVRVSLDADAVAAA